MGVRTYPPAAFEPPENCSATMELRWRESNIRHVEHNGMTSVASDRVLQQAWRDNVTGQTHWRDIPTVIEPYGSLASRPPTDTGKDE